MARSPSSTKPTKAKPTKAKQTKIPGTDSDRIETIDKEGERFAAAEKAIADATAEREGSKARLEQLLHEAGLKEYKLIDLEPPMLLTLEDRGEALKVKKLKPKADEETQRVLDA